MTKNELFELIKTQSADLLGLDESMITMTSNYRDDLGTDSLMLAELIFEVEEKFKIIIPDADAEKLDTVGSVVEYLFEHQE